MTTEQFREFTEEVIPQQLFHVDPADIDDDSGGKLDETILVGLIAKDPSCLKHKPLQWFLDMFLYKNGFYEQDLHVEIEQQFLQGDIIGSDDFFPSSEEELFHQIQEDEREEWDKK